MLQEWRRNKKRFRKGFYWNQKAKEKCENYRFDKLCKKYKQLYIDFQWCKQCNSKQFQQEFPIWTSENEYIDKFIQEAQLSAENGYKVLEWISYNKLKNIIYIDEGGFSKIYKAIWLDGPIDSWNFDKQQWNRWTHKINDDIGYKVILKSLNDSSNLNEKFLNEVKHSCLIINFILIYIYIKN